MPSWSLNIDYILQRGWLLLLQRMRSGRANSAGHINVIFLRHSCNLPSCNYIIWHLSALFPKSEWQMIFLFCLSEVNISVIPPQHFFHVSIAFFSAAQFLLLDWDSWAIFWLGAECVLNSTEARRQEQLPSQGNEKPPERQRLWFAEGAGVSLWRKVEALDSPSPP